MPGQAERDMKHARAVRDIAAARFDFPTKEFPNLRTATNQPEPTLGIALGPGEWAYPDIVVTEQPRNVVKMIVEVETADSVTEEEAAKDWKRFSELVETFYLYVPAGYSDEAKRICKRMKVKVAGIRTWRNIMGMEKVDITEVYA